MAHEVVLDWTDIADPTAQYNVYRANTSGGYGTTPLNSTPLAVGVATFTDDTVGVGTSFYVVRSVEDGLESPNSNEVSVRILPPAPTGLTVASSS